MAGILDKIIFFSKEHTVIAIAVGLTFLYLMFRKPKFFLGLILLGSILSLIWYFVTDISSKEKSKEKEMIERGVYPWRNDKL